MSTVQNKPSGRPRGPDLPNGMDPAPFRCAYVGSAGLLKGRLPGIDGRRDPPVDAFDTGRRIRADPESGTVKIGGSRRGNATPNRHRKGEPHKLHAPGVLIGRWLSGPPCKAHGFLLKVARRGVRAGCGRPKDLRGRPGNAAEEMRVHFEITVGFEAPGCHLIVGLTTDTIESLQPDDKNLSFCKCKVILFFTFNITYTIDSIKGLFQSFIQIYLC